MIPRDSWRNNSLAPDQIFSAGFRDGMNARAAHPQFQSNVHYLKGYIEGCRSRPDTPPFIAFSQSQNLDTALQSIEFWERDQKRFGFGKVALGFRCRFWVVLVTQDLHDAALPF
jgi:hypothetical protein